LDDSEVPELPTPLPEEDPILVTEEATTESPTTLGSSTTILG
jgi:hypothetical protein